MDGATIGGRDQWAQPSVHFDGANRNVQWPFRLGQRFYPMGEDFTAECWFWLEGDSVPDDSGNRIASLMALFTTSGQISGWQVLLAGDANTTGTFIQGSFLYGGTGDYLNGSTGLIAKGGWHHVSLTKAGMMGYLHYDGNLIMNQALAYPIIAPSPNPGALMLGMTAYTGYYRPFHGFLNDFRYTVGKARYGAANFNPFTAPFPNGPATYTERYEVPLFDTSYNRDLVPGLKAGQSWRWRLCGS